MAALINRAQELAALNAQLKGSSSRRKSSFILVYGRRRVGKSTLLKAWAAASGIASTYFQADKDLADVQRRAWLGRLMGLPAHEAPRVDGWGPAFELARRLIGERRQILIFDEVPYLAASDGNFYAALQHAWDTWMQDGAVTLVLCGSHLRAMDDLMRESSPLFGRLTLPLHLEPLAFGELRHFFPKWTAEERVAAYAMVGGVPEYYEWLEPGMSLVENLKQRVIQRPSPFLSEARFLLHDHLEQPAAHLSVIRAIGQGHHSFEALRLHSEGAPNKLSVYLDRLQGLRLVAREVSALVPPQRRRDAKDSRWILRDPYLRFYFRFIAPALESTPYQADALARKIWAEMRAFVGETAFEELCRAWTRAHSVDVFGFQPTTVGGHRAREVQADVVAVDWTTRQLAVGECKWDATAITREQARKLIEHTAPHVLAAATKAGAGSWKAHTIFFSRAGFTKEARAYLRAQGTHMCDLAQLDRDRQLDRDSG